KHDELQQTTSRTFAVRAMPDDANGLLNAARYHPDETPWIEQFDVIQVDNNFMPVSHIAADRAEWDDRLKLWRLTNGWITTGLRPQDRRTREQPYGAYKSNVTPEEIALFHSGEFVDLLSTQRIKMLLE